MARRLLPFVPAVAWAAGLWLVGGLTTTPTGPAIPHLDKVAHFALYGVLGFLLGLARVRARPGVHWAWLLAFPLLLGVADEVRQSRMETRDAELADWLADAAGAVAGFHIAGRVARRQPRIDIEDERR